MRMLKWMLLCVLVVAAQLTPCAVGGEVVKGNYLQVRSTVQASGEALAREHVLMGWKVREGSHHGIQLNDLAVVAIVSPGEAEQAAGARARVLVDARANQAQQSALVAMVEKLAGETISGIRSVQPVEIELKVCEGCALGYARLKAPALTVRTRGLLESDGVDLGEIAQRQVALADVFYRRSAFTLECTGSVDELQLAEGSASATVGGFALEAAAASRPSEKDSDSVFVLADER